MRVCASLGYHGWLRISELCSDGVENGVPGLRLKDMKYEKGTLKMMIINAKNR